MKQGKPFRKKTGATASGARQGSRYSPAANAGPATSATPRSSSSAAARDGCGERPILVEKEQRLAGYCRCRNARVLLQVLSGISSAGSMVYG